MAISLLAVNPLLQAVQDPALLQIGVVEGEGAVYAIGSRATRGITVRITDETGAPVEGATVSFHLPEDGPSGTFAGGGKTEIATSHADGRAAAWGMQWNRSAGLMEVRITASKGKTRAGIVCSLYLSASADAAAPKSRIGSAGGHKWLWIALGVAGAAAAAVAGVAIASKSSSSAPSTGVQIGAPTIALGNP